MKDELDRILDDALASYSAQEPRLGLERRVMTRIRSEGETTRHPWLRPALAAAVIACAAMAVVMWRTESVRRPGPVAPVERTIAKKTEPPSPVASQEAAQHAGHRRAGRPEHGKRLPHRGRFPTPAPLPPAEVAFATFVRQAPEAARQLAAGDKPLEIQAINIRPLEIDGLEIGEIR